MRIVFYLLITGVAAAVTFGLSIVIWKLSTRYRLYPKIRARDVHTRPTPRLGGVAMFLGLVVAFTVASLLPAFAPVFADPATVLAILGAALLIVLIGVADDIWDLDWLTKLAGQMVVAGVLAWQGATIATLPVPGGLLIASPFISLLLTVFIVVLVMNALNFIDGLDGLVAGVAVISNGVFFIYSYVLATGPVQTEYFNLGSFLAAVIIGVCAGFLPLNWHPARLFMGDAGALLVGLLMAAATIAVTGSINPGAITGDGGFADTPAAILGGSGVVAAFIPVLLPFAVLIIPLLDFSLAVLRRLRAGKSPFSADRKHLHHRLLDMGHSHFHAVLIFYAWTAVASVGCLLFLFVDWWWALALVIVGLVVCSVVTLAPITRRKQVEAAVQSAGGAVAEDASLAQFDPLDAASVGSPEHAPSREDADRAFERIAATGQVPVIRRPPASDPSPPTPTEEPKP